MSRRRLPRRALLVLVVFAVAACGVGYDPPAGVELPAPVTVAPTPTPEVAACEDDAVPPAVASYPPLDPMPAPGQMPAGSYMAEIAQRGRLVVGTSIDTILFASVDPTDGLIKGFDVDMARLVASAIFGIPADSAALDERVELRGITFAQRIPALLDGSVDLVTHTMTVNCRRWQLVAFSTVYLDAGQDLLVAADSAVTGVEDLAGRTVCVSAGGTSADEMRALSVQPPIEVIEVPNQTDCLVAFERGDADAIRSDDTILAGFAEQNPATKVVGVKLTEEPYGLAMAPEHPEFTRFVNGVLQQARDDGTWQVLFDRWLSPPLTPPAGGAPAPDHSRPVP